MIGRMISIREHFLIQVGPWTSIEAHCQLEYLIPRRAAIEYAIELSLGVTISDDMITSDKLRVDTITALMAD
jgi:hypothetical protein